MEKNTQTAAKLIDDIHEYFHRNMCLQIFGNFDTHTNTLNDCSISFI